MLSGLKFTPIGTYQSVRVDQAFDTLVKNGVLFDRRNGTAMEMDGYSAYLALKSQRHLMITEDDKSERAIVDVLLNRMRDCKGFWQHPAWTGSEKEVHLRFTAAAIRLLVEAYTDGLISDHSLIVDVLHKHLGFKESLSIGPWFLHDSLEVAENKLTVKESPVPSTLWNKSTSNGLVLNTHIDTLITLLDALDRLPFRPTDRQRLINLAAAANQTLLFSLSLEPRGLLGATFDRVDGLVRGFMFRVNYTKNRYLNYIRWRIIEKYYSRRRRIKCKNPFFVFRNGYIERDICGYGYYFFYHVFNVHDLARYALIAKRSALLTVDQFEKFKKIVDRGLAYACREPFVGLIRHSLQEDGRAIVLLEAMLLRAAMTSNYQLPTSWRTLAKEILEAIPPSPAVLGYDPLVVRGANRVGEEFHFLLLNGDTLVIDMSTCDPPIR